MMIVAVVVMMMRWKGGNRVSQSEQEVMVYHDCREGDCDVCDDEGGGYDAYDCHHENSGVLIQYKTHLPRWRS